MAPIDATLAAEAVRRVADFFSALDSRPREETTEAMDALREGLGLEKAAQSQLLAGAGQLLSKRNPRTAGELEALKAAAAVGVYLALTAEQLRQDSEVVVR